MDTWNTFTPEVRDEIKRTYTTEVEGHLEQLETLGWESVCQWDMIKTRLMKIDSILVNLIKAFKPDNL